MSSSLSQTQPTAEKIVQSNVQSPLAKKGVSQPTQGPPQQKKPMAHISSSEADVKKGPATTLSQKNTGGKKKLVPINIKTEPFTVKGSAPTETQMAPPPSKAPAPLQSKTSTHSLKGSISSPTPLTPQSNKGSRPFPSLSTPQDSAGKKTSPVPTDNTSQTTMGAAPMRSKISQSLLKGSGATPSQMNPNSTKVSALVTIQPIPQDTKPKEAGSVSPVPTFQQSKSSASPRSKPTPHRSAVKTSKSIPSSLKRSAPAASQDRGKKEADSFLVPKTIRGSGGALLPPQSPQVLDESSHVPSQSPNLSYRDSAPVSPQVLDGSSCAVLPLSPSHQAKSFALSTPHSPCLTLEESLPNTQAVNGPPSPMAVQEQRETSLLHDEIFDKGTDVFVYTQKDVGEVPEKEILPGNPAKELHNNKKGFYFSKFL